MKSSLPLPHKMRIIAENSDDIPKLNTIARIFLEDEHCGLSLKNTSQKTVMGILQKTLSAGGLLLSGYNGSDTPLWCALIRPFWNLTDAIEIVGFAHNWEHFGDQPRDQIAQESFHTAYEKLIRFQKRHTSKKVALYTVGRSCEIHPPSVFCWLGGYLVGSTTEGNNARPGKQILRIPLPAEQPSTIPDRKVNLRVEKMAEPLPKGTEWANLGNAQEQLSESIALS